MMKQYVTYDKKELEDNLVWIKHKLNNLHQYITMMEEQGREERSNLDWKSVSRTLRLSFTDVLEGVNRFGV